MTNRKKKLIELLAGSLLGLEQLPEEILKEDIYDETGHVDLEFMTGILDYMSKSADITVRVQKALNHLLGCEDNDEKEKTKDKGGENWSPERILQNCKWDGQLLTLPHVQLKQKSYLKAKKWIEEAGGSWNTSKQGFTWVFDANRVVQILLQGRRCDLQKDFQFFATPTKIADLAVSKFTSINPNMTILEPSAGRGALIEAVRRRCPSAVVDCYELMPENVQFLEKVEGAHIIGTDFTKSEGKWQRIIANPPFSGNQDIDHVYMMYDRLDVGGELSCIVSQHWKFANDRKCVRFREWLEINEADVIDIDGGEFKESGTSVATSLIHIVRKLKVDEQMTLF
jgi:hypothetical protein